MSTKLVISDVDGTIVRTDKSVAPSTIEAASRIKDAGAKLSLVSARPPRGIRHIQQKLGLNGPLAGFNGGRIVDPDGKVTAEFLVPEAAARAAFELFAARSLQTWAFVGEDWLITDPDGAHVDHERHTVDFEPTIVDSLEPYLARVSKMVGVTDDAPFLEHVEGELQKLLGNGANAKRSQTYYLDLTAIEANKGNAVRSLASAAGIDLKEVAVLGDMVNDVPMFDVAGYSVAMGNATDAVKAKASAAAKASNDHDGWAEAIDTYILPRIAR